MTENEIQEMKEIAHWFLESGGIHSRYFPTTNDKITKLCQLVEKLPIASPKNGLSKQEIRFLLETIETQEEFAHHIKMLLPSDQGLAELKSKLNDELPKAVENSDKLSKRYLGARELRRILDGRP